MKLHFFGGWSLASRWPGTLRSKALLVAATLAVVPTVVMPTAGADDELTVSCRPDRPVEVGETMTWTATVSGGSGDYAYSWTGNDGMSGDTAQVTRVYDSVGFRFAFVTVTDQTLGGETTGLPCHSHVLPSAFAEPPNAHAIIWVPKGVDPTPMVAQLRRVWRSIHALFYHQYGKTFRTSPLKVVVSAKTAAEICGGDCRSLAEQGQNLIIEQASHDAAAQVQQVPYTRALLLMVWNAGGWAGSFSWDDPLSRAGDWAVAAAAGVRTPPVWSNAPSWVPLSLGYYKEGVSTLAHELNHGIAWDSDNHFQAEVPPSDYDRQFSLAGPFLTQTPADTTRPTVTFASPASGATLSGTVAVRANAADGVGMDATVLLVDGQFWAADTTAPYSIPFNTTEVGHGRHTLTAIAYDRAGNTREVSRDVLVENRVAGSSCGGTFPVGTFHVCYFDGAVPGGPFLGTLVDHPFPQAAPNVGYGVRHLWEFDEAVAFGQTTTVRGVWRATLNFPADSYLLRVSTLDDVEVQVDGVPVSLTPETTGWATHWAQVRLAGPTRIRIDWREADRSHQLSLFWQPVNRCPGYGHDDRVQTRGTPGNDVLAGSAADEVICGLGGDDVLAGWGGNDVILGGAGTDTADYNGSDGPVEVNLATNTATGQGADTLTGIENVKGSSFGDLVSGTGLVNVLTGAGGADDLRGLAANDRLFGGPGDDVLSGGTGNDHLDGGAGTDTCLQGSGSGTSLGCEN